MKQFIKLLGYSLFVAVLLGSAALLSSCTGDKPKAPEEENLRISLEPVPVNPVRAMGASYEFQVKVESRMPKEGVTVQVDYKRDSDNASLFSRSYSASTTPVAVRVEGIPFNQVGTVSVVVTSKTRATNTVSQTFQLVRK